jgi:glycosyltransferase involved in cell wall biosynthesis
VSDNKRTAHRIAVFVFSLEGGGAERSMLTLVRAFLELGREVDLVVCRLKGAYVDSVPSQARLVVLESAGRLRARLSALFASRGWPGPVLRAVVLPGKSAPEIEFTASLKRYLRERRPDVLLSAMTYANLAALWARNAVDPALPVAISERLTLTQHCESASCQRKWRWRYLPAVVRQSYPSADAIVAVSNQVGEDLVAVTGLPRRAVKTIYNPVVDDLLRSQAAEPLSHPWFNPDEPPVIIGVGRLAEQKDFATLIRAFAHVRAKRSVRLLILGEGRQRDLLQDLAQQLNVQADLAMPGFVDNPFQYMARAAVLVQSSEYEGLPGVLIQALACGCPVVSTDCPGGAAEILEDGRYGPLVPVGDDKALAGAIEAVVDEPPDKAVLLERAEQFSVDAATSTYLELLDTLVAQRGDPADTH